jgi:diaminopimelate epimerase
MKIPFTKAHGAHNDFLLTWRDDLSEAASPEIARAICDRHTGVGADGWIVMSREEQGVDAAIELWNSDGSTSAISGNGTRCAAALVMKSDRDAVRIRTGAGVKHLRLLNRAGRVYSFEMNMGRPVIDELDATVQGQDATIVNVGNPQCAIFVSDFPADWNKIGASIERDPRFRDRTNVSFIRVVDRHAIDVRFFERGAGETMSSGTGSTGAAAAAVARRLVESPVEVRTPAGPLAVRWQDDDVFLAGPAEIVATGEFYFSLGE